MNNLDNLQIFKLKNQIQNYAWGSKTFIPELLGKDTASQEPQAELWMGSHLQSSSKVMINGEEKSLREVILTTPEEMLGEKISRRFNNCLPFLFKVLAAANPLSIQVHPNKTQAEVGFKLENEKNISLDSSKRNYKDDNHKPELICALTYFELMCGFQPIKDIVDRINYLQLDEILVGSHELELDKKAYNLQKIFSNLMNKHGVEKNETINKLRKKISELQSRDEEEKLIFKWIKILVSSYPNDMGVFSPLFLNVLKLEPGDALFLKAGVLHSYLDGCGIEIMANSNNVLRGGLTPKNIDLSELLKVLKFDEEELNIIQPEILENEYIYRTSIQEFQLSKIVIRNNKPFVNKKITSPEIILCTSGSGKISWKKSVLEMKKGESIFIPFSISKYTFKGTMELFRAVVPIT